MGRPFPSFLQPPLTKNWMCHLEGPFSYQTFLLGLTPPLALSGRLTCTQATEYSRADSENQVNIVSWDRPVSKVICYKANGRS
jgi:hypothetical protein